MDVSEDFSRDANRPRRSVVTIRSPADFERWKSAATYQLWQAAKDILVRCNKCERENRRGRLFCASCGTALPVACGRCDFVNEASERFCGGCGRSIEARAAPAKSDQAVDQEGDRRPVTVLFCDPWLGLGERWSRTGGNASARNAQLLIQIVPLHYYAGCMPRVRGRRRPQPRRPPLL
jgi:hypothetical protein